MSLRSSGRLAALTVFLVATTAIASVGPAQGLLDIADELYEAGKYEEALGGYRAVVAARPDHVEARIGASRTLIRLNRAAEVIDVLGDLPERKPPVPKAKAVLGEAYYWQGQVQRSSGNEGAAKMCYLDAVIHSSSATKLDPKLHRAFYVQGLAKVALDPNAWDKIVVLARKAHELAPDDRDYARLYGQALSRTGQDAKAAALLDRLATGTPSKDVDVATLVAAGASHGRAGNVAKAKEAFVRAFRAEPGNPVIFQQLWAAFGNEARYRPIGIEVLNALAEAKPAEAMVHYYLGHLHQRNGDAARAEAAFERCVATPKGKAFSEAWGALAELALAKGDERRAVECGLAALRAKPANEHAFGLMRKLVAAAMSRSDWVVAEERARAMLDHRPNDPYEWANVANCLTNQRRYKESYWAYERAVKLAPDNPKILTAAASLIHFYALPVIDPEEEAVRLYERALEKNPDELFALENLGMILGKRGELDRAEALLSRVLELEPGRGVSMRELNRVRRKKKQAADR